MNKTPGYCFSFFSPREVLCSSCLLRAKCIEHTEKRKDIKLEDRLLEELRSCPNPCELLPKEGVRLRYVFPSGTIDFSSDMCTVYVTGKNKQTEEFKAPFKDEALFRKIESIK